jgi:CubicO group peptidase (beta-lactamase class C family)
MEEWRLPALSISVIQNRQIAWQGAFGVRSIQRQDAVDDETVFQAASLTKPVFAYTVLRLCDEGLLDLDTPLVMYAPKDYIEEKFLGHSMEMEGFKKEWFSRITARMALSHSSGLQHFGLKTPVEMRFEPGKEFYYSSNGIEYLRYIVEHLAGSRIDTLVELYVLRPFGMTRSSLVWRDEYEPNAAAGHDHFGETTGAIERFTEPTAQATLYTTGSDYGRFLAAAMKGEALADATFTAMVTPQIDVNPGISWGLGFGIEETEEGKGIWHWGDFGSYTSYFHANLDRGSGFVYFSNSHYGLAILETIFSLTVPGVHPALSLTLGDWSFAEDYLSPATAFKCSLYHGDPDRAQTIYREAVGTDERGDKVIDEASLQRWGRELLGKGRATDAMMVTQLWLAAYHPEKAGGAAMEYVHAAAEATEDTELVWAIEIAQAQREPHPVSEDILRSYTGMFDPYEITLEAGSLLWGRPGAEKTKMIALDERTFIFEGLDNLKMEMVIEEGKVTGVKAVSSGGNARTIVRSAPADLPHP